VTNRNHVEICRGWQWWHRRTILLCLITHDLMSKVSANHSIPIRGTFMFWKQYTYIIILISAIKYSADHDGVIGGVFSNINCIGLHKFNSNHTPSQNNINWRSDEIVSADSDDWIGGWFGIISFVDVSLTCTRSGPILCRGSHCPHRRLFELCSSSVHKHADEQHYHPLK